VSRPNRIVPNGLTAKNTRNSSNPNVTTRYAHPNDAVNQFNDDVVTSPRFSVKITAHATNNAEIPTDVQNTDPKRPRATTPPAPTDGGTETSGAGADTGDAETGLGGFVELDMRLP
jgi:hypothetical protein